MSDFITKDSGKRQEFDSGAVRDTIEGKPRYSLIPVAALRRWADLMARGAEKYGERNWELGMPTSRYLDSAMRHLYSYVEGDRTEDHLAAVLFNVGAIIHFENGQWDDLNEPEDYGLDDNWAESFWDDVEASEQLELQPEEGALINWDLIRKNVEAGKYDSSSINWAPGQAPEER